MGEASQLPAKLNAVDSGHGDIQDIEVKDDLATASERALSVQRLHYIIAAPSQDHLDQIPDMRLIVNDQDFLWHTFPLH
jgi:hypothetical protein